MWSGREAYQLFEVPSADLHVALILIQTLGKRLHISLAAPRSPLIVLVGVAVGLACDCVVRLLGRGAGAATKHSTDRMAD